MNLFDHFLTKINHASVKYYDNHHIVIRNSRNKVKANHNDSTTNILLLLTIMFFDILQS